MPIDPDRLLERKFKMVVQSYEAKDCMLYALGLGLGLDPCDPAALPYVYEDGLRVLPTMACVLAAPGFWFREPDSGIDWLRVVHAEQSFRLHRSLQPNATVRAEARIIDIIDKGREKGALIRTARDIYAVASGEHLATVIHTAFCRGEGGFRDIAPAPTSPEDRPRRAPDLVQDCPTSPQGALIYRLSGDDNPLHADPAIAMKAGFRRPILHGLATFGLAAFALTKALSPDGRQEIREMSGRFSSPVYPGETLRVEIWTEGRDYAVDFRVMSKDSGAVVLKHGRASMTPVLQMPSTG